MDALFAAAYPDLHRLARSRLRGGGRSTCLDTTALVHESYLRWIRAALTRHVDRASFFAYASRVMKSIIVDTVRERRAERRGGDLHRITLDTQLIENLPASEYEVLDVDAALSVLAQAEPRLAKIVEMHYFGGFSYAEMAQALDLNERTVRRDWDKARLLLSEMLRP